MGRDDWGDDELSGADQPGPGPEIRAELAPGERLIWEGRPSPGRMVLGALPIAAFGVAFGGFAVFWSAQATANGAPAIFSAFGLILLAVGAAMALSPFWAGWKAAQTRYAITDRRAIILEPRLASGVEVRNYRPEALGNVVRRQRLDGSGDLIFEEIHTRDRDGDRHVTRRGFLAVGDVREVEQVLRSTLLAGRDAP